MSNNPADPVTVVRERRLQSYVATPADVMEHFGLESEISQNYRGRLVYEMLQNADDAMDSPEGQPRRVLFWLTDDALLVANTGRPISEDDLRALCGLSVSTQTTKKVAGQRRATIGQKGIGFKSVLEITPSPEAHSTGISFRFDEKLTEEALHETEGLRDKISPGRVPVMRLPFPPGEVPLPARQSLDEGYRTVFWFPLRKEQPSLHDRISELLEGISSRSILFLRSVDELILRLENGNARMWQVKRETLSPEGAWNATESLPDRGVARVTLRENGVSVLPFLVFVDREVQIGPHRAGLDRASWEGVGLTEVAVAVPLDDRGKMTPLVSDPRIHVFLPTEERNPFPFLVNGAFSCDLSRQAIRVSDQQDDYNRFLFRQVAHLVCNSVLPTALQTDHSVTDLLHLFDRRVIATARGDPLAPDSEASHTLIDAMRESVGATEFVPVGNGLSPVSPKTLVIPPSPPDAPTAGPAIRKLLGPSPANLQGPTGFLPEPQLCQPAPARILIDLGARPITCGDLPGMLAAVAEQVAGTPRDGGILGDPILDLLVELWHHVDGVEREALEGAVRASPLFPVQEPDQLRRIRRVAMPPGEPCFYPPRGVSANVPLPGVVFMCHAICWGKLTPVERNERLRREMSAWQALWGVEDFKFDSVMRAAILPRLALREHGGVEDTELRDFGVLAAICQLSSRRAKPDSPLVHERLGTQRNLFPLCRLPVPCRGRDGEITWVPAYEAYFGRSWIGDKSVEAILEAMPADSLSEAPRILVDPELLRPHLARYSYLESESAEIEPPESGEVIVDEADENEDEDVPLDAPEDERWHHFLAWIGVNSHLRPIGLVDVDARGTWTSTANLERREVRGALSRFSDSGWQEFRGAIEREIRRKKLEPRYSFYLYRAFDLESLPEILAAIRQTPDGPLAETFFVHLAAHWPRLSSLASLEVAMPDTPSPNRRTKLVRAYDHEIETVGESPWVWQLRRKEWCPTGHGPRTPGTCWLPSTEVLRRFRPSREREEVLLPTIPIAAAEEARKNSRFSTDLGIRSDLNPSTFTAEDCVAVLDRLAALYGSTVDHLERRPLREVINPIYRHLFELVPSTRDDRPSSQARPWRDAAQMLGAASLLAHDGNGTYRFMPAREVIHAGRRDTRARAGLPERLWTFVLEGHPAALAPLRVFFGCRILEEILQGVPTCSEPTLTAEDHETIRTNLRALAPYLLCRLESDRAAPRLIEQDARNLQSLLDGVDIVGELSVAYSIDGAEVYGNGGRKCDYYWQPAPEPRLFISWGELVWPPDGTTAESLAAGLCEGLNVTAFESFLALIRAASDKERKRLLARAAAPHDDETLSQKLRLLEGNLQGDISGEEFAIVLPEGEKTVTESGLMTDLQAEQTPPMGAQAVESRPLWDADDLAFDGEPNVITGEPVPEHGSPSDERIRDSGLTPRHGGIRRTRTDLDVLDRTGMTLALRYERLRLSKTFRRCTVFDQYDQATWKTALVFDVSTPQVIAEARAGCSHFEAVIRALSAPGTFALSEEYPGFDIMSLTGVEVPEEPLTLIDRLIELKSSGVHARVQEMTWNEWKTAEHGQLAGKYWLYLIGNLRSDLHECRPFLQMVCNPFSRIRAVPVTEQSLKRKIQIHTEQFEEAEIMELTIARHKPMRSEDWHT